MAFLPSQEIHKKQSLRMFELVQKHPPHWPPFIPPTKPEVTTTGAGKEVFHRALLHFLHCATWLWSVLLCPLWHLAPRSKFLNGCGRLLGSETAIVGGCYFHALKQLFGIKAKVCWLPRANILSISSGSKNWSFGVKSTLSLCWHLVSIFMP